MNQLHRFEAQETHDTLFGPKNEPCIFSSGRLVWFLSSGKELLKVGWPVGRSMDKMRAVSSSHIRHSYEKESGIQWDSRLIRKQRFIAYITQSAS